MHRVLIVKEGHWGSAKPGDYEFYIDLLRRSLEDARDSRGEKFFQVDLIETTRIAEQELRKKDVKVVIFVSRGMSFVAKKMAQSFPKTRFIIFTGLIPEEEIIWVQKSWAANPQSLIEIVSDSIV